MSRQLVESFFPALTGLQRPLLVPRVLSKLLPEDVANRCPEIIVSILAGSGGSFPLRRPCLAVSAILGIQIGLGGSLQLWLTRRNKKTRNSNGDESSVVLWSLAFLFFGMMNVAGLLVHCLLPAYENRQLIATYPTPWALDCVFTGFSSMCLIGAGLSHEFWTSRTSRAAPLRILCNLARSHQHWIGLTCVLAAFAILSFLCWGITSPLELWYLWIIAVAGHILLPITAVSFSTSGSKASKMQRRGMYILFAGGLLFAIGLAFDSAACYHLQDALLDLPTAPTLLFLGCDVSFFGLYIWLRNSSCYNFGTASKLPDGSEKVE
jgi:hypothetical protein